MLRIGEGFDVHAFCAGDYVTIGGVKIPHHQAIEAHSDGDVLLHAICDALLGSLALGDIGSHFPDTDPQLSNVDSQNLLAQVMAFLKEKNARVHNIDATIIAQTPKMSPHIMPMREVIANHLSISLDCVSIKATTTEKLGFTGRKEGIAAKAVVLVDVG